MHPCRGARLDVLKKFDEQMWLFMHFIESEIIGSRHETDGPLNLLYWYTSKEVIAFLSHCEQKTNCATRTRESQRYQILSLELGCSNRMDQFKAKDPDGYYRTKRANVVSEILVSEFIYVKRLNALVDRVMHPLLENKILVNILRQDNLK